MAALSLLTALLLVMPIAGQAVNDTIRISAPDIDPLDGTFNKSVRISMVSNARAASIHYTIDGTLPTDHSPVYKEPFDIVGRGEFIVRAIAFSDTVGRNQSVECKRKYVIRAVEAYASIFPSSQTVRGSVNVSMSSPPGTKVEYLLDFESQWRPYEKPFVLSAVGQRLVKARIQGNVKPVVSRQYLITPPLVFDVSVNCDGCGAAPSRCRPFTVWVQGARDRSQLFLTSSSQGCEKVNHVLDGTQMTVVDSRLLGYTFISTADPGKVWVCLSESGDPAGPFVSLRGRKGDVAWFSITESSVACSGGFVAPTTPTPPVLVGSEGDGISLANVLLWIVGICGLAWFVKAQRAAAA